jgi:hypothetical protein
VGDPDYYVTAEDYGVKVIKDDEGRFWFTFDPNYFNEYAFEFSSKFLVESASNSSNSKRVSDFRFHITDVVNVQCSIANEDTLKENGIKYKIIEGTVYFSLPPRIFHSGLESSDIFTFYDVDGKFSPIENYSFKLIKDIEEKFFVTPTDPSDFDGFLSDPIGFYLRSAVEINQKSHADNLTIYL